MLVDAFGLRHKRLVGQGSRKFKGLAVLFVCEFQTVFRLSRTLDDSFFCCLKHVTSCLLLFALMFFFVLLFVLFDT